MSVCLCCVSVCHWCVGVSMVCVSAVCVCVLLVCECVSTVLSPSMGFVDVVVCGCFTVVLETVCDSISLATNLPSLRYAGVAWLEYKCDIILLIIYERLSSAKKKLLILEN